MDGDGNPEAALERLRERINFALDWAYDDGIPPEELARELREFADMHVAEAVA